MKRLVVAGAIAALIVLPSSDAYARANATPAVGSGAGSAMVATSTSSTVRSTSTTAGNKVLPQVQTRCDAAVKHVTALENLKKRLNASKYVKAEDKSGLLAEIASDESGLNALDSKIQADTTTATAISDCKGIVTNYRVYVLEAPKVREILALDTISSIDAKFQALSPVLAAELTAAQVRGTDVTAAEKALTDLNTKAAAINKTDSALTGLVLLLQPSAYPTTQTTIKSTRQSLSTMTTEAKGARADVQAIATALGVSASS